MYKESLPSKCPPADASEQEIILFRALSNADANDEINYIPYSQKYASNEKYKNDCRAHGLSFFDSKEKTIEKTIKGIYAQTLEENPPKTHHLLYLIERIQSMITFEIPENIFAPIREIDKVSIPVRYPENLRELAKDYQRETTLEILTAAKEVLHWLNSKLNK